MLQSLKTILLDPKIVLILAGLFTVSLLIGWGLWALEHEQNEDIFPKRGPVGTVVETFLCGFMLITQGTIHYVLAHASGARYL